MDQQTLTDINAVPQFLSGGGEMGKLIRSKDWSATPLGSPDTWPQSLRTTISLCIASNFPISITWGPYRVQIYNDGYWPVTGDKHPVSMGQDFKECWLSAWPVIGQAFEEAFMGHTRFLENQRIFIDRYGYLEETFFTFSFSPILDESGSVAGLFHPVIELTQQIIAERRLDILLVVADHTVNAKTVEEASSLIMECLKDFELDLPFVLLYSITADGKEAQLQGNVGVEINSPLAPAKISLDVQQPHSWPFIQVIQNEKASQVEALEKLFGTFNCGPYSEPPDRAMVFPITLYGTAQTNYFLVAGVSSRRSLDEKYLMFYELLTSSITNALTKAGAYEDERKKAEALAEIDRSKTVFFSNISHEFRTPLTLMLGSLEELLNKGNGEMVAGDKQAIETSHRNAMRLLRLVNNLLDFSRIEAGRVQAQYQLTDLAKYTTDLASNFRSVVENAGLIFQVNTEEVIQPVYIDKEMWEKIVLNLLSNAFKYTLKGSITISLTTENDRVLLKVKDTGVGIPENELPKMFQRFHRVENVVGRTYEGTGIGLSLVSELVKLHGGEISVQSKEGEGSVFTVSIPMGKSHLPAEHIIEKEKDFRTSISDAYIDEAATLVDQSVLTGNGSESFEPKADASTVLVVDDNADMRAYIKNLLQNQYLVITANNGVEALQQIKEHSPQLILSDIMMPIMDGIQLLKAIKENIHTQNIPVILLSARAGEESKIEGLDIGADDYLIKPFSAKELIARVQAQIKIVRLRQSLEGNLRNLFMEAPAVIGVLRGPQHVHVLANEMYLQLAAKKDVLGKPIREVLPELEGQGFFELLDNVYSTGKPFIGNELPARLDMGKGKLEEVYLNFVYQPSHSSEGEIDGILVHAVDVTEQVLSRKKIEDSEKRFSNLLMESPFAFAILKGKDMVVALANDAIKRVWGKGNDIEGKSLMSIMPEIKEQGFAVLLENVYTTGKPFYGHEQLVKLQRNGIWEDVYFNFIYQAYKEADETISGVTIIANEVTTQAIANKKIAASEQNVSRLFMDAPAIICVLRGATHIYELANASYLELIGKKDIIGKTVQEVLPELEGQSYFELLDAVYATGEPFIGNEMPVQLDNGAGKLEELYLNFVYQPTHNNEGEIHGILVHAVDVTEQVLARKKVEESESRFRNLADESPMFVFITDPNLSATVNYWNRNWLEYTGQTFEEAIERSWDGLIHPDDVTASTEIYTSAYESRRPYYLRAIRVKRYDGEFRWHMVKGNPRFFSNGDFNGYVGVGLDIHDQKLAEEKIAYRTALLEAHNESSIDGILLVDAKGKIISYNQRFIEIWNMPKHIVDAKDDESALSFAMTQLVNPQQFIDKVKYLYDNPAETSFDELEYKDGKIVERFGYPVIGEDGTYYAWSWTFKDITERKKIEQDLKGTKEQLELTFKNVPSAIYHFDKHGNIIYLNELGARQMGYETVEEVMAEKNVFRLINKWDETFIVLDQKGAPLPADECSPALSFKTGKASEVVAQYIHRKTGFSFWLLSKSSPLYNELGELSIVLTTGTDITLQKTSEQAIRKSEEDFRNFSNSIYNLAWMADDDGNIYWYNQRWYDYTGTTLDEMKGWGWGKVHHPTHVERVVNFVKDAWKKPEPFELTFPLRSRDGEYRWFLTRGVPILDEAGKIQRWIGTNTDINEQKLAEDGFRTLSETLPHLVWMTDEKGKYEYASPQWMVYSGLDPKLEFTWEELVHPDDIGQMMNTWARSLASGETYLAEARLKSKEGIYRWYFAQGEAVKDEAGKILKWIGAFTDIHEQKTLTEKLENLVAERTKELRRSNEDLQQFAHVTSHDLKEPVRKFKIFNTRLSHEFENVLPEKAKLYVSKMESAATRLSNMIDGVLLYSSLDGEMLPVDLVDLNEVIRNIEEDLELIIDQKKAKIQYHGLPMLEGSAVLIYQLFYNLINNSLKFSRTGISPLIKISAEVIDKKEGIKNALGNYSKIMLSDNGIGFSSNEAEKIFKPFSRLNSKDKYEGTGLGLALCKKIAERHGGTISASGIENEGSGFEIILPLKQTELN